MGISQPVRFWLLFVTELGFLILWPAAVEFRFRLLRPDIIRDVVLLLGILAVSNKIRIAIVVAILGFAMMLLHSQFEAGWGMIYARLAHLAALIILLIIVTEILTEILYAREVRLHLVVGAACIYMALAIAWTFLYFMLETLVPGSVLVRNISLPYAAAFPAEDAQLLTLLYVSFASISTLGNNVVPVTFTARQLATIEAITGQLYIAILIARLVGFSIAAGGLSKVESRPLRGRIS
jgi:hypothetical protein